MLGFLKKLFGFDEKVYKEAGVQIEQQAPYKVEAEPSKGNSDYHDAPDWLRDGDPKTMGVTVAEKIEIKESALVAVEEKKPAAMKAPKKPVAPKKPAAPKKPVAPAPAFATKRGRKPKAKS